MPLRLGCLIHALVRICQAQVITPGYMVRGQIFAVGCMKGLIDATRQEGSSDMTSIALHGRAWSVPYWGERMPRCPA